MKKNKNIFRSIFLSLLLVVGVLVFHPIQAQADSNGTIVKLTQTAWGTNTAAITWEAQEQTTSGTFSLGGYHIYLGTEYSNLSKIGTVSASATSYQMTNLQDGKKYYVKVLAYDSAGVEKANYYGKLITIETIPAKVKNFKQERWWYFSHQLDVSWDRVETADNVYVTLYNSKGKKVGKTQVLSSYSTNCTFSNMKDEVYKVTMYAQKTVNGKIYKTSVSTIQCFNQARIASAKVRNKKLTIKWGKVGGATGYDIYVSKKPKSGYKKVKSLSKNVNKVVINKLQNKAFNAKRTYYVYVETKKKNGKKVSKSGRLYYWNTKNTSYSYF